MKLERHLVKFALAIVTAGGACDFKENENSPDLPSAIEISLICRDPEASDCHCRWDNSDDPGTLPPDMKGNSCS
jgi:hypothetical protein